MTHAEMVLKALEDQEIDTNREVQQYIREVLGVNLTTGEISDIRQAQEERKSAPWRRPARTMSEREAQILEHPWYISECSNPNRDDYWS